MKSLTLAAALTAAGLPIVTLGAPDAAPENLIVSAPTGQFLQPTQALEGRELTLRKANTLGETLANEPGIASSAYGKGSSRPIIRGQQGPRVQVLKDNIGTLDVSALSPDHNPTVEPLLVERIEIVRGPQTLAYGSSAAAGLVNVLEGRIPADADAATVGGAVEVRGDTVADSRAIVARLDGRTGQFGWHLDASTGDSDNYDIGGFATADPAERDPSEPEGVQPNSFTDFDSFAAGGSWLADNGYTGVSVSRYETQYGLVGPEASIDGGPFIDLEQTRVDVRGEYDLSGFLSRVRFALGINDYEHSENEEDGEIATLFDNSEWEGRVELSHQEVAGFTGTVGLQLIDRDFEASGEEAFIPNSTAERYGLFIIEDIDTSFGQIQLGLRAETADYSNTEFADYDDTAFSAGFGLVEDFGSDYEFSVNLSLSERVADIEELYSNGLHLATNQVEIGLVAQGLRVDKELASNIDFGIARTAGRLQWSAKLFYTRYEDYIYQRVAGEVDVDGELFPLALYTQDDARFVGAEVDLNYALVTDSSYALDVRLFGDFVEAELIGGGDLPRIPPLRAGAELAYSRGNLASTVQAIYHAEQDDISSFTTASYTLLNWNLFYAFEAHSLNWEVFARANNLLDEEARQAASFVAEFSQLPGRNFEGGIRLMF